MARIGEIGFGGHGRALASGTEILSAVAYTLSAAASSSGIYTPTPDWEVEIRKGQICAVARTSLRLEQSALLSEGLELIHRHLDLVSYERKQSLLVKVPSEEHVTLFHRDSLAVVRHCAVHRLGMEMMATIIIKDAAGNVVEQPAPPPPIWTPALRFYRLSQTSRDLFEAYRSLWLGFEALLSVVCPRASGEREKDWVMRALSSVGQFVDLASLVPSTCKEPVAYIVGTQYEYIRSRLFHAKLAEATDDVDLPDPEQIAVAYERLLPLWRQTAERCLSIRTGVSSAMTYSGFGRMRIDRTAVNALHRRSCAAPQGRRASQPKRSTCL